MDSGDALPPQLTAVFSGQRVGSGGAVDMHWVLSLTARSKKPSAFGASWAEDSTVTLRGSWERDRRTLLLTEGGRTGIEYQGCIAQAPGSQELMVQGTWRCGLGEPDAGAFAVCAEAEGDNHTSGLWLGSSVPAPELAPFLVPTNPILWALSLQPAADRCFGCGFFDDAADVPGQPLLFFTLSGGVGENGEMQLTKTYEHVETGQTDDIEVQYVGTLQRRPGGLWLEGKWENQEGGSYGSWHCRCEPSWSPESLQLMLCSMCVAPIHPGELRFNCQACVDPWSACERCVVGVSDAHYHPLVPETMTDSVRVDADDCAALAFSAFREFEQRRCVGYRVPCDTEYTFVKYCDLGRSACAWAGGLEVLGVRRGHHVLVSSEVSPNYVAALLGVILLRAIMVPIPSTCDSAVVSHVVERTKTVVAVLGSACVDFFPTDALEHVVVLPPDGALIEAVSLEAAAPRRRLSAAELLGLYEGGAGWSPSSEVCGTEEPRAVLWTSGSTGVPKGAVFTESHMMPVGRGAAITPFVRLDFEPYDPTLPLSIMQTLRWGGYRCIAAGLDTLLQDFQLARPTHIGAMPSLWTALFREFQAKVEHFLATLPPEKRERSRAEARAGEEMRNVLGNRVHVASSGGASVPAEVLQFVHTYLKIDIADCYGTRETGGIAVNGEVYPGVEVRLRDLPDFGYFSTDSPPRGEVLVHSPRLIPGYVGDEDLSAASFVVLDGKRFYCTGDVGEFQQSSAGKPLLRIVDRCSFFFKLSQGEWVSPAQIEGVLERSPRIEQAFVVGLPAYPFPVAVIVPRGGAVNDRDSMEQYVRFWCANSHRRPFETPQRVHIEPNAWTPEVDASRKGGLTANLKKDRPWLMAKYRAVVLELFGATREHSEADTAISPGLAEILRAVLPQQVQWRPEHRFAELGGDSLTAGRLCALLRQAGVDISIEALYDYPLGHLSDMLEAAGSGVAPAAVPAPVNWEAEWRLPLDFPDEVVTMSSKNSALLTGCTGFLGPLLLAELLRKCPQFSTVYCLARGSNSRVRESLPAGVDFSRVRVLVGDLLQPRLGLTAASYEELSGCVRTIIHNGAVVNHLLPYSALSPTNVGGTVAVIRLAAEAGAQLSFVSSVAALPVGELSPENWVGPLPPSKMEALNGYGQSKAVAEELLHRAVQLGLCVRVLRLGDVCPDRVQGRYNTRDTTLALVRACALLRAAPRPSGYSMGWIPADAVASAVVSLSAREWRAPAESPSVHHLAEAGPRLDDVLRVLESRGFIFESVTQDEWRKRLRASLEDDRIVGPALPLLERIAFPAPGVVGVAVDSSATRLSLEEPDWVVGMSALESYAERWVADGFLSA